MSAYAPGEFNEAYEAVVHETLGKVDAAFFNPIFRPYTAIAPTNDNTLRLPYVQSILRDPSNAHGSIHSFELVAGKQLDEQQRESFGNRVRLLATTAVNKDEVTVNYVVITQDHTTYMGEVLREDDPAAQHEIIADWLDYGQKVPYCRTNPDFVDENGNLAIEDAAQMIDGILKMFRLRVFNQGLTDPRELAENWHNRTLFS